VALHFPSTEFGEVAGPCYARMLTMAGEAGLRVLLVRFRVSPEYLRASRPFRESTRVDERLAEILAGFPESALLDARLDFHDGPELFIDTDRMNQVGARRMARTVRRRLDEPAR
jgi:hypothetical protein